MRTVASIERRINKLLMAVQARDRILFQRIVLGVIFFDMAWFGALDLIATVLPSAIIRWAALTFMASIATSLTPLMPTRDVYGRQRGVCIHRQQQECIGLMLSLHLALLGGVLTAIGAAIKFL